MTELRDLNQAADVPEGGFASKAAIDTKFSLSAGISYGTENIYSPWLKGSSAWTRQPLKTNAAGTNPLSIYVPPLAVDAWLDVSLMVGIFDNADNTYQEGRCGVQVTPVAFGPNSLEAGGVQRNDVTKYGFREASALFPLAADTAATIIGYFVAGGGSWRHHCHSDYLQLHYHAFAR